MFAFFDNLFINQATRLMQWLNREQGLMAPVVLRESLMAFLVAYSGFGIVVMASGDMVASVMVVMFGAFIYPALWGTLTRYSADAGKDWDHGLAMRYMSQAIGKQESMRLARGLGWVSVLIYPALLLLIGGKVNTFYTVVYFASMGSGLIYEYLCAAEPTAPGERRQQQALHLAHASNR